MIILEIEHKYLINKVNFNLEKYRKVKIIQGYISVEPEIRIRKMDEIYLLTEKGHGNIAREENEKQISKREFVKKLELIIGNRINKTRYYIPIANNYIAELDIYNGNLLGLVTVEVEFPNVKSANEFVAPNWFGENITFNNKYKNKNLSQLEKGIVKDGKLGD